MVDLNNIDASRIKKLVEEMKLYNNPELLEKIKKLLKKNVPFSMRGYLLAYLYVTSKHYSALSAEKKFDGYRTTATRPELSGAVSLYINVGKQSRVPLHVLKEFICTEAGVADSDVPSIVYKQNYSFVYVKKEKAENIIKNVNGKVFRNRRVKVNFSDNSTGKDEN